MILINCKDGSGYYTPESGKCILMSKTAITITAEVIDDCEHYKIDDIRSMIIKDCEIIWEDYDDISH